jgi:carbonic anhydrase/acetyltransferase-like protein (isoleucine patch superfamily)
MTLYKLAGKQPVFIGTGHFVADSANLIGDVVLKTGSSVWFNAVIRADNATIEIGERSNVQDGAVLHTDPGLKLTLGVGVTIGHNAMLHGCTIGDNTLIGIGAVILNHAVIGRNCIVGANALVTERMEIPDNSLVVGSPAKIIKKLDMGTEEMLALSASIYEQHANRYNKDLQKVES